MLPWLRFLSEFIIQCTYLIGHYRSHFWCWPLQWARRLALNRNLAEIQNANSVGHMQLKLQCELGGRREFRTEHLMPRGE